MTFHPSENDLTSALDDVFYEIHQLVVTAVVSTNKPELNNSFLESRLLHARNLLCFFESEPRRADDVLATDYGFRAERLPISDHYRRRLHKDLAHLTYSRARRQEADRHWPLEEIVQPILNRSSNFVEHLLSERRDFGDRVRKHWETLLLAVAEALGEVERGTDA